MREKTLTPRQLQIVKRLVLGQSDQEISLILGIKASSVRNHVGRAREVIGASSREQLIALLVAWGAVQVPDTSLACGHIGRGSVVSWKAREWPAPFVGADHSGPGSGKGRRILAKLSEEQPQGCDPEPEYIRAVATGEICDVCIIHMAAFELLLMDEKAEQAWLSGELPAPRVWW